MGFQYISLFRGIPFFHGFLRGRDYCICIMVLPLCLCYLWQCVVNESLAHDLPQTLLHHILHLKQPVLHVTFGIHNLLEGHVLTFTRVHLTDAKVILELQLQEQTGIRYRFQSFISVM